MIDVLLTVALFAACIMAGITFLGFVCVIFLLARSLGMEDKNDDS